MIKKAYVQRHGDNDTSGDQSRLTELGIAQVRASVMQNLPAGIGYVPITSGMVRTNQTALEAMHVLGFPFEEDQLIPDPHFGFSGLDMARYKEAAAQVETLAKQQGRSATVADWLQAYPEFFADVLRPRFTKALLDYACDPTIGDFYVASHSPTSEFATPTPEATGLLNKGDFIVYTIKVNEEAGVAEIISAEILRCPPVEPPAA